MSRLYVLLATCVVMALVCACYAAWRIKKEGYSVQDLNDEDERAEAALLMRG